jgi:histone acetyltransferase MYST1
MDEWISSDRILQLPSAANALAAACVDDHGTFIGENLSSSMSGGGGAGAQGLEGTEATPMAAGGDSDGSSGKKRSALSTVAELEHDEHEGMDEAALREHEEVTKIKNIRNVLFGKHKIECWYFSPYPKEFYPDGPVECLYVCEFSFRFFRTKPELVRYLRKPQLLRHPPGNEIYRDSNVSMFEVDGAVEKAYCQNLSYFAKLFLDHKTLYFDVDPFLFYVLCSRDERGYHPVGYFSKEK